MTTPEPIGEHEPIKIDVTLDRPTEAEAFAAHLLYALRHNHEVEDAVHAAAERAEMRHPDRQPPAIDAGRYARRM
jgi:hypothetical protein